MRSIWVVLLTTIVTVILVGGSVAGFLYYKENFGKPKESRAEEKKDENIAGKNLVLMTSDSENLILNYLNLDNKSAVKKTIKIDSLPRGGKWAEANKNQLIQFDKNGKSFIYIEAKEANITDQNSYFKFVKADYKGRDKEILLEQKDASISDYVLTENKIYYLKSVQSGDVQAVDLMAFDIETKKDETLAKNIGDFFQKELVFKDNKIYSMYRTSDLKFFESVFDISSKALEKKNIFTYKKNKENELVIDDVYPSPDRQRFLYKDNSSKDGYSLKIYDAPTKKTSVLVKDKNYSFDKAFWISNNEVSFLKNPVVSQLTDEVLKNEILKVNLSLANAEESIGSSANIIYPLFFNADSAIYLDDKNVVYVKGGEKKEFQVEGVIAPSDLLFIGTFEY